MFQKILNKLRGNRVKIPKFQASKKNYNFYEVYGEKAFKDIADMLKKEHNAIMLSVPDCKTLEEIAEIRGALNALTIIIKKLEMHAQKHKQSREKSRIKSKK